MILGLTKKKIKSIIKNKIHINKTIIFKKDQMAKFNDTLAFEIKN